MATDATVHCGSCPQTTEVVDGIWHAMGPHSRARTLAQLSNVIPPTPQLYERLWRHRSLSILSGHRTTTAAELQELTDTFVSRAQPADVIVDVACSEGLYARTLALGAGASVIAVDHSLPFLRRLRQRCGALPIMAVQAPAQFLPIADAAVAGVVMGGSLNEIGDERGATREMGRIAAQGATLFSMSLTPASTRRGQVVQTLARLGGVRFPTTGETSRLFTDAGFALDPVRTDGVVLRVRGHRA